MAINLRDQLQSALAGAYILDRELGGGGMSRVFLSTEVAFDRRVVVKVLPPELAVGVSAERFRREISLAAKLQHAHIVPMLSAGDANGLAWFTMPFIDGESLRTRLGRGELPIAEAVRILRDVATALGYAHDRGVVHRDIKPENILVAGGVAMVSDFGVAKAIATAGEGHTLTSVGVVLGTPAYMSPEQIAADPKTDHRADIYAFGVLAYELITGSPPFVRRGSQSVFMAHVGEAPVPVNRHRFATPAALNQIIMRCLEKSPEDRPQSAYEIVNQLDAISGQNGGSPRRTPAELYRVGAERWSGRWTRIAAVVAALIVVGLAWVGWQRMR